MAIIFNESVLPKLTYTSLFTQISKTSNVRQAVIEEIQNKDNLVDMEDLKPLLALMQLNGGPIIKKALLLVEDGTIVIHHSVESNPDIPVCLPYIIMSKKGGDTKAYVFADKVIKNLTSSREYDRLMVTIEAAYLSLLLNNNEDSFLNQRELMFNLCQLYVMMVTLPLEQKLYMKGDNLTKAMVYTMAWFYQMIDGDTFSIESIYHRMVGRDAIDKQTVIAIQNEVKESGGGAIMALLNLIKQINPIRYENLDSVYLNYFTSSVGLSLIFALENISYLFLFVSSANYKSSLSTYSANKLVNLLAKKISKQLIVIT